jgi:membrane-bound ClpP family serine protease
MLLQLPGSVIAAGVLGYLAHAEIIPHPIAYGLFALWVAGEVAMFPAMRIAYEPGARHTGSEAMVDAVGAAEDDIDPEGHVRVGAERWRAVSMVGRIESGAAIRVLAVRDLTLVVERFVDTADPDDPPSDPRGG